MKEAYVPSTKPTHTAKINGIDVEVEDETGRASLSGVRAYFGPPTLTSKEIMACKKVPGTNELLPDWDQLATGIGNGTLTY